MDNLIGVNGIVKIKQECGLLSFNERSVFHKVGTVSVGTSLCLVSSSVCVGAGVSLCLWCGGGERMQRKGEDQVSGGPGALKAQGSCVGTTGTGLAASAFCLLEVPLTGYFHLEHLWANLDSMGSP